jgi:hypothetical protein
MKLLQKAKYSKLPYILYSNSKKCRNCTYFVTVDISLTSEYYSLLSISIEVSKYTSKKDFWISIILLFAYIRPCVREFFYTVKFFNLFVLHNKLHTGIYYSYYVSGKLPYWRN